MCELTGMSRRVFGQSLGAIAALTFLPGAGAVQSAPIAVEISKFKFEPKSVTVKRGDTVRWTNGDAAPHTATSGDGNWDTGRLGKQEAVSITFQQTGTFPYFCAFHRHMKGEVTVVD